MVGHWRTLARGLLLCAAFGTAAEAEQNSYRWLSIEGRQVRWVAAEGAPIVLRYAIASYDVQTPNAVNCGSVVPPRELLHTSRVTLAEFRRAAGAAFAVWQRHIAISFAEVSDQREADIIIGEQAVPAGRAFANVKIKPSPIGPFAPIEKATICLNPQHMWKIGYDGDLAVYDLVHTLSHEIGHVIGLDHPAARGHIMSFKYRELDAGLSDGDIQGAVALYGPRPREHSRADKWAVTARATEPPTPHRIVAGRITSRSAAMP